MITLLRNKNFWSTVGLVVLILILSGVIIFTLYFFSFSGTVKMTSKQLHDMYSQNEAATNEKLSGNIIEITGTVASIDNSNENPIEVMLGDDDDDSLDLFDTKLTMKEDQKNLVALLNQDDELTANCSSAERIMNTPFLDGCSIVSIFTPLGGDATHKLFLDKIYSNYNGNSFDFGIRVLSNSPTYVTFIDTADCISNKVTFKSILFTEKDKQGKEKTIDSAEFKNPNAKQNKIIQDGIKLNSVFLGNIEEDSAKTKILHDYIQSVCALPTAS